MKKPLHTTVYQTCCQTVETLCGFMSVHLLRQRAYERFDRVSAILKQTLTALFRGTLQRQYSEILIPIDERHKRGSLYSLHGSDPRSNSTH